MSKTVRQIYSVALSATTVAVFSGAALAIPAVSGAQTMSCTFTRSLTVGSRGADVTCLQNALVAGGLLSATPTGYFGSLTKAAVVKWQMAAGVSPASGFFGAISRAKYASMMADGTTMPNPTMPTMPTVPGTTVPGAGVSVSAAGMQPSGSAIAGAGQIDVAKYTFTASNMAGVTVTNLKLSRTGVVSDSNISNLYLADESGVVFAQYSSLNNGIAMFDGLNMMVNAGQSRVVTLRMDLSSSASAGNTLGWRLDMVTPAGNGAVTGLPVSGPTLTVTTVTNPSLGAVSYTYASSGSTVDAGTNAFLAHSATVNVTNSAVLLKSLKFTVVGSANTADLKNAKLSINGVAVATASMIGVDGKVVFIPTTDVRIPTGNNTFEVRVDVAGSPNRTMAWNILRPYDAVFYDTQYNTNVTATTSGTPTTVTINQGRVTVNKDTSTPTANIPLGASNITLAKFSLYAGGEPVKVRFLPVTLLNVGDSSGAVSGDVRNISVIDDVGNSVGTTVSSPSGSWGQSSCDSANVTGSIASTSCDIDFGTSSSYINYIVPANTTRVLSVKVDLLSTANITSLRASLGAPISANLEGQISFVSSVGGTANGNSLVIATTPLTVATNPSFGTSTNVAGANGVRVASFILNASSAEGEKVSTLTFRKEANDLFDAQNLRVMVGGTQFGTTQAIVGDTDLAMSFSGSNPIIVPAGGSVTVDLYADILTSTTQATHSTVFDLSTGSANGQTSNSAITWPAVANGQSLTISSGSTLTLTTDSSNTSSKYLVMESTDNVLYKLRLEADNTEDIRVTDITFRDTITNNTSGGTAFSNLALYDGATLLATINAPVMGSSSASSTIAFSLGSGSTFIIPKNTAKTVTLKGDVVSFSSNGAKSGSSHVFGISATTSVIAFGKDSSQATTVSGTPSGSNSAQIVYRSKPSLTSTILGAVSGRTRGSGDEIAMLNFSASSQFSLTMSTVVLKFAGLAVTSGATAFPVELIDSDTPGSGWGSATTSQTCTPIAGNTCTVTFAPNALISAGTTKGIKLRVDAVNFTQNANTADSVSVTVNTSSGLLWTDGTSTGTGITWDPSLTYPLLIGTVSYE